MKSYLFDAIDLEIEYQEKLFKRLKKRKAELDSLPDNNLIATNSRGRIQYYLTSYDNRKEKRRYLGKKEEKLRKNLQEKHYLKKALTNCSKNLEMLLQIRESYYPVDPCEVVKNDALAYQDQEQSNELVYGNQSNERWRQRKFSIKNNYSPYRKNELRHIAIDGTVTRTKSEALIVNLLIEKSVTFVYEVPMRFKGILKSPDFLIYDRKNNREVILEHMGRMDKESYREDQYDKLGLYIASGWVPNVNLILTFDDANGNINIPAISKVIDAVLL